MAGTILTPTLIWKDFSVETDFNENIVAGTNDENFSVRNLYINGRTVGKERVGIFATAIKSETKKTANAILYIPDLGEEPDMNFMRDIASRGYLVLTVDLCGYKDGATYFTKYPTSISYANYAEAKDNLLLVKEDARKTCWYEWGCILRYAIKYLKGIGGVEKVGGFAVGEAATALWQVAGMDKELDCAVFALNAGWAGYRGIDKFGGQVEPQFSDDAYKFIAGIDSHSYAMHVTCPTLVLAATNSAIYDCDRVYDTLTHIAPEIYSTVNYSVGYINSVDRNALLTADIFLDNFIGSKAKPLPSDIDVVCESENGKLKFTVSGQLEGAKEVSVYVCEETTRPSIRAWRKVVCKAQTEKGEALCYYSPFSGSDSIIAFAESKYKSGYTIGSKVISKKFTEEEVSLSYKSNVIYSSRNLDAESVFVSADQSASAAANLKVNENGVVEVKKGPMGINGVYASKGLLTFKINAKTDRPQEGAIIMFDLYSENKGAMAVKLIADYFGEKVEYFAWTNVMGGEVWQNVKLELLRFKTEQGMSLKSLDKIDALEFFIPDGFYLVNNALWV